VLHLNHSVFLIGCMVGSIHRSARPDAESFLPCSGDATSSPIQGKTRDALKKN